jgi:hypothetical protein
MLADMQALSLLVMTLCAKPFECLSESRQLSIHDAANQPTPLIAVLFFLVAVGIDADHAFLHS